MKMSDAFPSTWLKADDLKGRQVQVTIQDITMQDIGDGEKPVATFLGKEKGLVLNKTNASMIADSYGDETDDWIGKPIELYGDRVAFQGKIVPCIRVRIPAQPAPSPKTEEPPLPDDSEIPF